jgi:hypothetical protein
MSDRLGYGKSGPDGKAAVARPRLMASAVYSPREKTIYFIFHEYAQE